MLSKQSFKKKPILNPYYEQIVIAMIEKYGYRVNATQAAIAKQLKVRPGAIANIFYILQSNGLLTYEYINGTRKIYCISQTLKIGYEKA